MSAWQLLRVARVSAVVLVLAEVLRGWPSQVGLAGSPPRAARRRSIVLGQVGEEGGQTYALKSDFLSFLDP